MLKPQQAMTILFLVTMIPLLICGTFVISSAAVPPRQEWFTVARLKEVPVDGLPHRFPIQLVEPDAWTSHPPRVIGKCFVRRFDDERIVAIQAEDDLGTSITFDQSQMQLSNPCLCFSYDLNGQALGRSDSTYDLEVPDVRVEAGKVQVRWP